MTSPILIDTYANAVAAVGNRIKAIQAALHDLPAPDSDHLTWGHVGDIDRMLEILDEIQLPKS